MSVDIENQIGNLFDEIQGGQTPVTIDEITALRLGSDPVRPIAPLAQPATPRPRWLVVVAAAVAVLLLGGGAALFIRVIGSDGPVATTPPTVDLSSLRWSPVTQNEAVFGRAGGQSMMSVTAGGPGLVAVGSDELSGAAAWTSSDGITWTRAAAVPRRRTFSSDDRMESVTAGGPGLVGVGTSVWTSVDGIAWTLRDAGLTSIDTYASTGSDWQLMTSVTAGGPGLVAVGINWSDQAAGAVWTSVDGITWSRVPHDEAIFGSSIMTGVTVGGPGLVAVGIDNSNPDGNAGVWTSVDGITWSRVPNTEEVFGGAGLQRMMSVTAGGPGLVAVGSEDLDEDFVAAVWTSVDGVVWSRVPHDETVFVGPGETMTSVTATEAGLVAVGPSDIGSASWTSVDGTLWSRVALDETAMGTAVTVGGPGLVAVGSTGWDDPDGEDVAVWIGEDQ
jgi:hypothetical protein